MSVSSAERGTGDDSMMGDAEGGNAGLAVSVVDACKRYKHFQMKDVSLSIPRGSVAGLIGPNGAGKSTTMRMLMGLVQPDSGRITVLGQPISSNHASIKQQVGYYADDLRLYKPETIGWHMQFVRSLYPTWDDDYANHLVERFGLIEQQAIKGLSHGQRVKASLLLLLARRPNLLILDEPTDGLDPVAKQEVLTELMRVVEDDQRTILYSSHDTKDVEQISDSITFIDRGHVVGSNDRDAFLESWRRIQVQAPDGWTLPAIDGIRLESTFRSLRVLTWNQSTLTTNDGNDQSSDRVDAVLREVQDQLLRSGVTIESIDPMTLEEIFVSSVTRGREGR
jgi:ABC-2 type transport system ATP-binding protein